LALYEAADRHRTHDLRRRCVERPHLDTKDAPRVVALRDDRHEDRKVGGAHDQIFFQRHSEPRSIVAALPNEVQAPRGGEHIGICRDAHHHLRAR
jgi:hypothetical protein